MLIKPLVTEKSTSLGVYGKYVFKVSSNASKRTIKKAIHDLYGVEAIKVNIVNQGGKPIKYGRSSGRTGSWKKAIVTLKAGEKIEIYEGV
ncbi:MAG: 50S ribosomal protein L23 [Candidatus Kerfeldbacteria bacterium CG_4_10_14_0_8_um_filter_42_10]|uniref:Large ribosomal subunit protein uL23 n=1 Tax=Candidatus Kerfeldbacteria bacterium CG_4_10_14_0_8_um_filter_42_10 TaxID=2014248 RepID=A0A2M7RIJ4_9BACT|nr:MAG: 50S ribosomal protein L23 [Candidatus Kerfeldbacteria bacterium CG_4_10_14_0_8_um_filter_42_10]